MKNSARLASVALATAILCANSLPVFAQQHITACGQTMTEATGVLDGDLNCSALAVTPAITVVGKYLDLAGFTVYGQTGGSRNAPAIKCEGPCTISNGYVFDGTIGIVGFKKVFVENVVVVGGSGGIQGIGAVRVTGGSVTDTAGQGITGHAVRVTGTSVTSNDTAGITGTKVSVTDSTVTGNGGNGVSGFKKVILRNTEVTGNCLDPTFPVPYTCGDVNSCSRAPKLLEESVCDTSTDLCSIGPPVGTWGVCDLD